MRLSKVLRTLLLAAVATVAAGRPVSAQSLVGSTVHVSWWDTSVPGFCCTSLTPVQVSNGTTITDFAGFLDLTFNDAAINVHFTESVTFTKFFQLTFLFQPNLFPIPTSVGPGASQTGCCVYTYTPSLGGWLPWFGLGFGPSGAGQPFTVQSGLSIPVSFRFAQTPPPPPTENPGTIITPEPASLWLVAMSLVLIFIATKRRSRATIVSYTRLFR